MVERNMNEKDTRGERFRVMACVLGFASLLVSFFRIPSSAEFSFLPTVFFLFLFAPLRLCVKTILGRLCPGDTSRSCGGSFNLNSTWMRISSVFRNGSEEGGMAKAG